MIDNRGGDNSSYLTVEQKEELKHIILNSYPIVFKGWDGKIATWKEDIKKTS